MTTVLQDVRYALRLLARNPGFALIAVVTLALGIGVTTAVFTVVHAVLLRPLPYADPDRLVLIRAQGVDGALRPALASLEVQDLRETNGLFTHVGALVAVGGSLTSTDDGAGMERITAVNASDDLLPTLGVRPWLGRLLDERLDSGAGGVRAVLISHELWQRRYHGDASIVGRAIEVNNIRVTVAGVLPAGFALSLGPDAQVPPRADVWFSAGMDRDRRYRSAITIGRLAAGVTLAQARARLRARADELTAQYPDAYGGAPLRLHAERLQDDAVRDARPALLALAGAVACVLLVACANIANLLLSRMSVRSRELAVRTAVGANRGRLLQQLVTEGLVLGIAGGGLGLLLALWTESLLLWLRPANLPPVDVSALSAAPLAFALITTLAGSLLFSLTPALHGVRAETGDALKAGGRGAGAATHRLRSSLIVAEVALSVVLLIGAGLMVRTIVALHHVDLGFQPEGVLTLRAEMRPRDYSTLEQKWQFYRQALEQVRALPGVQSAAAISPLPLEGVTRIERFVDGVTGREVPAATSTITPDYFATMGIGLRQGRDISTADIDTTRDVVIVDEDFARAMWPGASALGQEIRLRRGTRDGVPATVVGVVAHIRNGRLRQAGEPQVYLPYHRNAIYDLAIALRAPGDLGRLGGPARTAIEALGGKRPVHDIRPMAGYLAEATADTRFLLVLLSIFASLALLLAAVGIYGVVSHMTAQRTREIGIRHALGATGGNIVALVMRDGLRWTVWGTVIGLLAAWGATRALETALFGVTRMDRVTVTAVVVLLAGAAAGACYLPARRALRLPAAVALRAE